MLKMHWISMNEDKPLQFQYRYSNNPLECWKTVNLKRTKGRPVDMGRITLPLLYDRPRAINPNKVSDLLELLDFVPPIHHLFYRCINRGTDCGSESNSESSDED